MDKNYKKNLIVIGILTLFLFSIFAFKTVAQVGFLPFGGLVLNVTPCTCDGTFLITVGPPVPGNFLFDPKVTYQYAYYQLPYRVGVWALGLYGPGPACRIYTGEDCTASPSSGTITIVGTSL